VDKVTARTGIITTVTRIKVEQKISAVEFGFVGYNRVVNEAVDSPITIFDWNRNFIVIIGKAIDHAIPTRNIPIDDRSRNISKAVIRVSVPRNGSGVGGLGERDSRGGLASII
jgi:hypothetical protein